jgi:23S rRNA (adenine2503-C2)-methyltransferase
MDILLKDENILCISTQIGCCMGCICCATTLPVTGSKKSFIRNLTTDEIVSEVKNVLHSLNKNNLKSKKILFSYFGMGEPFLNYKNVIGAIKILTKLFPNSRTTLCTTGIKLNLIKKLALEKINTLLKLQLSLHAPTDALRKKILPNAGKIKPALDALKYFSIKRKVHLKVVYVLIKNLNDSKECALQLVKLLKNYPFTVKLSNLNEFNKLKPSGEEKFKMFEKILNSNGIKTCRFHSDGTDINTGCGQLRRYYYNK